MVGTVKTILGKKEVVYSVDPTPTVAANAALTRNFTTTPIEVDQLDRKLDLPTRGRSKSAPTNKRKRYGFELELAGSGAAGTAAPWMEYLEACGMAAPVLVAATSATQRMAGVSDALSSMAFYDWAENQKRIGLGARGTFGWDFTAGAYPFVKLDYTALVPATNRGMSTSTPGTPSFSRWIDPVEINTLNTAFLLDGYAAKLRSFTGDVGADVKLRNLVGANYVQRGNHGITGRLLVEAVQIATKDYYARLDVGDEVTVSINHGTTAGNIVDMNSSHLQILSIATTEEDDTLMFDIGYGMNVGTGSDDVVFVAR